MQYVFDGLEKIIPVGKWVRPTAKVVKDLYSENIAVKDVFLSALEDRNVAAGVRVLDFIKIDVLLAKIKSRSSLDIDMKDFL
ncbi:hypothetical protein D3C72_1593050 [compost metagenome]